MFYWYLPRFTEAAFQAVAVSATTAVAAGVTITHRMMILADPATLLAGNGRSEALRMVAEKMDAAAEGSMDACFEVGRLALRSASGHLSTDDMAHGLLAIGVAAAKPAVRRARANAKRLSRT